MNEGQISYGSFSFYLLLICANNLGMKLYLDWFNVIQKQNHGKIWLCFTSPWIFSAPGIKWLCTFGFKSVCLRSVTFYLYNTPSLLGLDMPWVKHFYAVSFGLVTFPSLLPVGFQSVCQYATLISPLHFTWYGLHSCYAFVLASTLKWHPDCWAQIIQSDVIVFHKLSKLFFYNNNYN